jgi:hypothetical protein
MQVAAAILWWKIFIACPGCKFFFLENDVLLLGWHPARTWGWYFVISPLINGWVHTIALSKKSHSRQVEDFFSYLPWNIVVKSGNYPCVGLNETSQIASRSCACLFLYSRSAAMASPMLITIGSIYIFCVRRGPLIFLFEEAMMLLLSQKTFGYLHLAAMRISCRCWCVINAS